MSQCSFVVSLKPAEVINLVKEEQDADLIFEEYQNIENGRYYATLVFEKYFMRVSNRVALVVLVNNLSGKTVVKSVATGSSQGMIFNFDWGAADDFADNVRDILEDYIIEDIE